MSNFQLDIEENNQSQPKVSNQSFSLDIINAFGANCSNILGEPINFVSKNKYIIYSIGKHLIYRELSYNDNTTKTLAPISSQSKQTNVNLIYLDKKSKEITSLNVSDEKSLFCICENYEDYSTISIYFLAKITFKQVILYQPSRKIITNKYTNFRSVSFSADHNFIAAICLEKETQNYKGVIYDIQVYKSFKLNVTLPSIIFDIDEKVSKLSYEQRVICTSGKFNINFWQLYQNTTREIKSNLSQNKNYVDHSFSKGNNKNPLIIALTSENEIFIIEGIIEKNKQFIKKDDNNEIIDQFIIKQYINNIFNNTESIPTRLKVLTNGIIIGNDKGDLLFLEKNQKNAVAKNNINENNNNPNVNADTTNKIQKFKKLNQYSSHYYTPLRLIHRDINSPCTGISYSLNEDMLVISYKNNEIVYCKIKEIFFYLKDSEYKIDFHILCEGFHSGEITSMDTSIQRPIIVSASNIDKTIRIWNYISGHCEYSKIILTESEEHHIYNFNILALALHPNGYYLAIADLETIWFFHLCYRELRFYGTDIVKQNEIRRENCHILKFSNGGHLLCAVSGKTIFILKTYTRDLLITFYPEHIEKIGDISFSDNDKYLYSFGTDGFVFQMNLYTFEIDKVISKYINFTSGFFFYSQNEINNTIVTEFHIIGCGKDNIGNFAINEVVFEQKNIHNKYDDIIIHQDNIFRTDDKINCLIYIKSQKNYLEGLICGTFDGKVIIYPLPLYKKTIKMEELNVHTGKVNKIIYNYDSNLVFSCGEDGNVIVLCLYELKGNDEFYYDNRIRGIKQLSVSLDAGLGENVLFPLNELEKIQLMKEEKKNILNKFEDEREKFSKEMEMKLRFLGNDLNAKKSIEMKELNEKILELELKNKEIINHYENKIKEIIESDRKKYNEQNKISQEEIQTLKDKIINLEEMIEKIKEMSNQSKEETIKLYQQRFFALQATLRSEVKTILKEKEQLNKDITELKKEQNQTLETLNIENEYEKNALLEKQNLKEKNYEKIIDSKSNEITKLKDMKAKLEEDLNNKEKEIKLLKEKSDYFQSLISILKTNFNKVSIEREDYIKKAKELEKKIQEIEKIEKYSHKLKNEMYKKNVEISLMARKTEIQNEEYLSENKKLINTMNKTMTQIENIEKERNKLEILINNLKIENEELRHKYNIFQGSFDKILYEIFKSVQTNNKNEVYRCVSNIYKMYINDDFIEKIKKNQLNLNIQEELEFQINSLQNSLFIGGKNSDTINRLNQGFKSQKLRENAILLENFSQMRKKNINISKENSNLKGYNISLQKQLDNFKNDRINLSKLKKSNSSLTIHNNNLIKDLKNNEIKIINQIKDNYTSHRMSNQGFQTLLYDKINTNVNIKSDYKKDTTSQNALSESMERTIGLIEIKKE